MWATLLILAIINNGTPALHGRGWRVITRQHHPYRRKTPRHSHNMDVIGSRLESIEGEGGVLNQVQTSLSHWTPA
ncbi:MAG: hypothetical protein R2856_14650 [Caldilineaceae bacterium]